ncbi:uncharacterized protein cubi_03015 [Cryptosporidium ubiquitum]|uniref:V-SNARE coiled-coil homology domain-containing protein n=1 Tax=Cryptosporidium ubiquitum TaxID=857276 RepID=A0A1J4MN49_9CRYT|nr:uncharacterized protein cubi_03015 [Cryptosporidium ubiquitum]OII74883.1 hypothetical protein cubi_03015 [Cryptosporidium ubiquitum]
MFNSASQCRADYLGLFSLSNLSIRISYFVKDCPLSVKVKFSSYIDKIVNSAINKVNDISFKRLKWLGKYTIFLKKEYNNKLLIILLVDELDINFDIDKIFRELKLSLKTIILAKSQVVENINRSNGQEFKIENNLCESNFDLKITEIISNESQYIKIQIEAMLQKINLRKIEFANLMTEKVKISLNESLKTILLNCEDIRILEANSKILKKNSHQLFKNVLRDNSDIKRSVANLLFVSTIITATLLLLIK